MPGIATQLGRGRGHFYRDAWNPTSNGVLSTHVSNSGSGYTKHFGASYASGDITVDATLKRIYGGGTGASFYYANIVPGSSFYKLRAPLFIASATGNASLWLGAEHQSANGEDGYQVRLVTGSQWELRRIDNGTGTLLDSHASNLPTTGGDGLWIEFQRTTGGVLLVTMDGVGEILSFTDTTYTAVGRIGYRFSGPFTSTTGVHIGPITAYYIVETAEEEGGGAPTSYAMIYDREIRVPGALPSTAGAINSYIDAYHGTRVWRCTDATLDSATNTPISGVNGTGQGWTPPSSGDTQAISAVWSSLGAGYFRFYFQTLAGTDYIFRLNQNTDPWTVSREPVSTNNPGDGVGMHLSGIFGEPEFSHEDGDVIYGKSGSILKSYNFDTDTYATVKDVAPIGRSTMTGTVTLNGTTTISGSGTSFTTELRVGYQVTVGAVSVIIKSIASNTAATAMANASGSASGTGTAYRWPIAGALSTTGSAYGNSIAFITIGDADPTGIFGTAHGEMLSARWGGGSQDEHYVIGLWDATDIAGTQIIYDSHRQEIGDGTTMVPISDAECIATFDQDWGPLTSAITTTGEETISVTDPGGVKQWPEQGKIKIDSERCLYIKISETSLYIHTRGSDGTTPATHSNGATVTLQSVNSHGQSFDKSGRHLFITISANWRLGGGDQIPIFYDTQNDSFEALRDANSYSGHVSLGYAKYCNPPANADALDWYIHDIATPNTGTLLLDYVSRPQATQVGDHTSWHNASPTEDVPFESSTYRFGTNARDYTTRPFREWDDAILLVNTETGPINTRVWRVSHHRSFIPGDTTLSGTWTTNGTTTVSGSGGSANTELVDGDKIVINKESFVVVGAPTANSITVNHANVAGNVSGATVYAFSKAPTGFGFWYTPRGVIAPDGSFIIRSSNMEGNLGCLSTPADNSTHWRVDGFVDQLRTALPTAPTITVGPASTGVAGSSSTITSTTSTPTDTKIFFGATTDYGSAITGTVARSSSTNTITGTGTSFTSALTRGDFITISGSIYQVHEVVSNTSIRVQPPPGVTDSGLTLIKNNVVTNYNLLTSHSNAITPVSAGHHYKVYHRDSAGQQVASGDLTLS